MPEINWGPIKVKYGDKMDVQLTDIPALFHKVPGATEILDEVFSEGLNKYQLYNRMIKRDSDLNTAINKMSILARRAYQGIIYHPGEELEDNETQLLKDAKKKAVELKFAKRFYTIARRLFIDGDVLIVKRLKDNRLDFLPMELVTALNSLEQIHTPPITSTGDSIYSGPAGVYIYNEGMGNGGWKTYNPQDIVHVALSDDAEMVKDNQDRMTWGIWSQSPMEALRPIILWRMSTIVNDMIWRKLYLPREHHEIDLTDVLNPEQYEGDTLTDRRTAALAAASSAITAYIAKLKNQMPDQGYVTPKVAGVDGKDRSSVNISIIEPKSTTYVSPNDLLKQLAKGVNDAYFTKTISETNASFAAELVASSLEQSMAEFISDIIREALLEILREALGNPEGSEDLDIKLQLIMPKDVEALTRQVAVLASAKIYTINEMREVLGKDPLTEEDREQLFDEQKKMNESQFSFGANVNSADENASQMKRGTNKSTDKVQTPKSDFANQKT